MASENQDHSDGDAPVDDVAVIERLIRSYEELKERLAQVIVGQEAVICWCPIKAEVFQVDVASKWSPKLGDHPSGISVESTTHKSWRYVRQS